MIALLLVILFVGGIIGIYATYDLIHKLENVAGSLTLIIDYLKKMRGSNSSGH